MGTLFSFQFSPQVLDELLTLLEESQMGPALSEKFWEMQEVYSQEVVNGNI